MMKKMIERIAILTGLPEGPPPKKVRVVSLERLLRVTGARGAKAAYLKRWRHVIHAQDYDFWVPHEVTHMLQEDAGMDTLSEECEQQAQWVLSIYWRLWPDHKPEMKS